MYLTKLILVVCSVCLFTSCLIFICSNQFSPNEYFVNIAIAIRLLSLLFVAGIIGLYFVYLQQIRIGLFLLALLPHFLFQTYFLFFFLPIPLQLNIDFVIPNYNILRFIVLMAIFFSLLSIYIADRFKIKLDKIITIYLPISILYFYIQIFLF